MWGDAWRRLRRNRGAVVGAAIVVLLVTLAAAAPLLAPADPNGQDLSARLLPPSPQHLLGTDEFGRDMLSRLLYGARPALAAGMLAAAIAMGLGVAIGLVSGYVGGAVDQVLMRVMDIMLAFPYLLLAMIVVAILGPSISNAMVAVGLVNVPQYARLVRGCVLGVRTTEYVAAARALGIPRSRILGRHILPNVMAPIIIQATLGIGQAIVWAAGLSFLGLGAQPPAPEWGAMLASGREYMLQAPGLATFPGLAILVTVLGFNLLGDGLRDALDPRLR
ncbi:MAG: ABC transporter permease [Bacillota bacterium]|nr:ABC transporter permease [Bacillota bacterium]